LGRGALPSLAASEERGERARDGADHEKRPHLERHVDHLARCRHGVLQLRRHGQQLDGGEEERVAKPVDVGAFGVAFERPDEEGADQVDDGSQRDRDQEARDQPTMPLAPGREPGQLLNDHVVSLRLGQDVRDAAFAYPRSIGLRNSIFAATYDRLSRKSEEAGLRALRQSLLAGATGSVLEIGAGTGANLGLYDDSIDRLVLTEPESPMLRRLLKAAHERMPRAQVVQSPAEHLPFEDASFDTVVSTLVLCGVDDQVQALQEAHRVLKPGGRLLFLEHVRSDEPGVARFQDRMNRLHRFVAGCDCNRPTLATIEAEGFTVSRLERTELPKAPKFVRPLIVGSAST